MGVRGAIEVNFKNDKFGGHTVTYYVPCGGLPMLRKIRNNLKKAEDKAEVLQKLGKYEKKGEIRPDGRSKLTPRECWPFIEYFLRVNFNEFTFELEALYETVSNRAFAHACKGSTKTFVR